MIRSYLSGLRVNYGKAKFEGKDRLERKTSPKKRKKKKRVRILSPHKEPTRKPGRRRRQ